MKFKDKEQEAKYRVDKALDFRDFQPTDIDRAVSFEASKHILEHYAEQGEQNLHRICTYCFLNGIAFGRRHLTPADKKAFETMFKELIDKLKAGRRDIVGA